MATIEPDANVVWPRVWLGSLSAAIDDKDLWHMGITHVISLCHRLNVVHRPYEYRWLTIQDDPHQQLLPHFKWLTAWITELFLRDDAHVLVHCGDGVSRSAAVIIAWMISLAPNLTPTRAQTLLRRWVRPEININAGFMRQLWEWRKRQLFLAKKCIRTAVHTQCVAILDAPGILDRTTLHRVSRCIAEYC